LIKKWTRALFKEDRAKDGLFIAATFYEAEPPQSSKEARYVKSLEIFAEDRKICGFDFGLAVSPKLVVKFVLKVEPGTALKAVWRDSVGRELIRRTVKR